MAAPTNEFAFDFEAMEKAAQHWNEHQADRERKQNLLAQKRYDEVESKERLAKRTNRLLFKVKEMMPYVKEGLSEDLRDMVNRGPIEEDEIDNDLFERVIGETRDFLSAEFLENGVIAKRSVARLMRPIGNNRVSYGTGFLVSPHLLLTNHHVLKKEEDAARCIAEFDYQLDPKKNPLAIQRFQLDPAKFFLNNKELDFALVAIKDRSKDGKKLSDYGWCPLIIEEGKITQGDCINIIQHPKGETKQIIIRENKLVDLLDNFLHYEGDTEPGSSGSPIFNDQWEAVGLHHSGVPKMDAKGNYLDINGNIWRKGDDPTRLQWVANEGIRVSKLMEYISKAKVRSHEEKLRDELMTQEEPTLDIIEKNIKEISKPNKPSIPTIMNNPNGHSKNGNHYVQTSTGSVTLTIPLQITVSLGSAFTGTTKAENESFEDDIANEAVTPDPDYSNRPGYDSRFLGFEVPLPKLSNSIRSQAVEVPGADTGNQFELKYYHYSVVMNKSRRFAFFSAVNFNANAKHKHSRNGDRWFFDPRIKKEFQAGEHIYSRNPLDRGHLVRRADAAWGDTPQEAKLANDDTFHFTNCTPQHEIFNQSGKSAPKRLKLWGDIENHIANQAKNNNKKVNVFNGPIFSKEDEPYRDIRLPKEFWKIVIFQKDDGKPSAIAFIFSQESLIRDLPEEEFEVGEYRPFQVKIREIENRTKLNFGNLSNFDPLEVEENESFFEVETDVVPIYQLSDIII